MQEKRDIFDRMMALPILNIFEPFYKKKQGSIAVFVFWRADFLLSALLLMRYLMYPWGSMS